MPMHDWKKVDAGIFHAFHHDWITAIGQSPNGGLLPEDYYALPEQIAAGFGPDVLTLESPAANQGSRGGTMTLPQPRTRYAAETAAEFYRRKKSSIVDPFPPTHRDPEGVHAAIWAEVTDEAFQPPADKPLTLVAYETGLTTRAYIEPFAVGDALPEMPPFLERDLYVLVPLEATYQTAFQAIPLRWRRVLEPIDS